MNLTEFLLARIAEDYADAMAGWRWKSLPAGEYERLQARVLAECEAKRAIVMRHAGLHVCPNADGYGQTDYDTEASDLGYAPCPTMLDLAQPFADHPDFDPAWRLS